MFSTELSYFLILLATRTLSRTHRACHKIRGCNKISIEEQLYHLSRPEKIRVVEEEQWSHRRKNCAEREWQDAKHASKSYYVMAFFRKLRSQQQVLVISTWDRKWLIPPRGCWLELICCLATMPGLGVHFYCPKGVDVIYYPLAVQQPTYLVRIICHIYVSYLPCRYDSYGSN